MIGKEEGKEPPVRIFICALCRMFLAACVCYGHSDYGCDQDGDDDDGDDGTNVHPNETLSYASDLGLCHVHGDDDDLLFDLHPVKHRAENYQDYLMILTFACDGVTYVSLPI